MRNKHLLYALAFLICLWTSIRVLALPASRPAQDQVGAKPRLVLVLIIDQFRQDYLDRFSDLFAEGGFRRLMKEGAVFTQAHFLHITRLTFMDFFNTRVFYRGSVM